LRESSSSYIFSITVANNSGLIVEATSMKAAKGLDLPILANSTRAWAAEWEVKDPSFGMINSRAATVSSDF